jgi:hypothetical protein
LTSTCLTRGRLGGRLKDNVEEEALADGRIPPLDMDINKELELESEAVSDTLYGGLIGPIGEPDGAKVREWIEENELEEETKETV